LTLLIGIETARLHRLHDDAPIKLVRDTRYLTASYV
jgi:hypothetical protein